MKTRLVVLMLSSLIGVASAQLSSLPPLSTVDGILVRSSAAPPQPSPWWSTPLVNYRIAPDHVLAAPKAGSPDEYGHRWVDQAPSLSSLDKNGGTLRGIFLGASTPALQSMGYALLSGPQEKDAFVFATDAGAYEPSHARFGDFADVALSVGEAQTFDLWMGTAMGAYTLFRPENSVVGSSVNARILWTEQPLLISTFIPALGREEWVETWLVNVAEERAGAPFVQFTLAVQAFEVSGQPLAWGSRSTPVPEPAAFGVAGMVLCGWIIWRRRRRQRDLLSPRLG